MCQRLQISKVVKSALETPGFPKFLVPSGSLTLFVPKRNSLRPRLCSDGERNNGKIFRGKTQFASKLSDVA